jgi:hypothetical protein
MLNFRLMAAKQVENWEEKDLYTFNGRRKKWLNGDAFKC